MDCSVDGDGACPRINLCLSSPSFSSSLSTPSASNVSARVGSTGRLFRDVIDDVRDRKEGGGELGICDVIRLLSSFSATCGRMLASGLSSRSCQVREACVASLRMGVRTRSYRCELIVSRER